jgi:acetolactate synthase-1/3 small subunit
VSATPEPFLGTTSHTPVRHHILSVLVENKAGVLARIAGLFARRGFNIYSLAVAPAEGNAKFSRVTIVVDAESAPLDQIVGQLDKLVNVVQITDLAPKDALERELLIATVSVGDDNRTALLDTVAAAGASIVDVDAASLTVMLAGTPAACDHVEKALEVFEQVELHRTGRVALPRLGRTALAEPSTIKERHSS